MQAYFLLSGEIRQAAEADDKKRDEALGLISLKFLSSLGLVFTLDCYERALVFSFLLIKATRK